MPIRKQPEDRTDQSIDLLNFIGERTKPWQPSETEESCADSRQ